MYLSPSSKNYPRTRRQEYDGRTQMTNTPLGGWQLHRQLPQRASASRRHRESRTGAG